MFVADHGADALEPILVGFLTFKDHRHQRGARQNAALFPAIERIGVIGQQMGAVRIC